nr:sporamin A precursor [Ipomoea batatas]
MFILTRTTFDDKNEGGIGESQARGPRHVVVESADVVAFIGAELAVSEFVGVKVGIHHLNLELVAIVGDKLAGFQEILPGRAVVLDSPVHVVYAELVGGDVEPESLPSPAGSPYGGDHVVVPAGADLVAVDVQYWSFRGGGFVCGGEADGIEPGMGGIGEEIEGKG